MPSNTAADQVRIERQAKAWSYRQKGWTQQRIAETLQVDQSTVCRWLDAIEKRELARLSKRVESQKVRQTALLDLVVDESLQAWDRSKKPKVKTSKKTGRGGKGGEASAEQTDAQQRDGDPVHLATAMVALRDLRKLWGLDAAAKSSKADDAGADVATMMQRLKANASAHESENQETDSDG